MAQLVSSSVEGLSLDKVTITDGAGALLWPKEGADAGGGSATTKQNAEERHDQLLESQLTAMLARTVGPDKAQVQVSSELNVDKAKERKLTYGPGEGVILSESGEEEQLEGTGGTAGGRAGTAGNVPATPGGANGGGESNYERNLRTTSTASTRPCATPSSPPARSSARTWPSSSTPPCPPAVARQLEQAVTAAAGIDTHRGDTLTVNRVAFAKARRPRQADADGGRDGPGQVGRARPRPAALPLLRHPQPAQARA
jgi:flagellar M-ring protein FliF